MVETIKEQKKEGDRWLKLFYNRILALSINIQKMLLIQKTIEVLIVIKKRSLVSIFILIIFLSSLGISVSSAETSSTTSENITDSISSISSFPSEESMVDYRIVQIDENQNLDGNIFQDSFESKLLESDKTVIFDAILSFDRPVGADEQIFLSKNDIEIVSEYDVIYGMHVRGTAESILLLNDLKNALYIEENAVGEA
ncbi:MAG: hypothetical protein H7647_09180, partial [Candidatus Heimdallarchaeota archaeon]|nr:hypothetical protein [Candidatus Heimdallarchaeota archaeon]MCK4254600.1 hypothetical protein [Candidatus Heimdallarchaeota archaeon]